MVVSRTVARHVPLVSDSTHFGCCAQRKLGFVCGRGWVLACRDSFSVALGPVDGEVRFLKAKASRKIPVVKYSYSIYRSISDHSGHLEASTCIRCRKLGLIVSTKPSFQRRVLHTNVESLSTILLARRRVSRAKKLSSIQTFGCFRNQTFSVCYRRHIRRSLGGRFCCTFRRGGCPKIPSFSLRAVSRGPFEVGNIRVVPMHTIRCGLPVLKFQFKHLKCLASTDCVDRRSVRGFYKISAFVVDAVHHRPRVSRFGLSRTLRIYHHMNTHRSFLARLSRRVNSRTRLTTDLPRNIRPTCSKLTMRFWTTRRRSLRRVVYEVPST